MYGCLSAQKDYPIVLGLPTNFDVITHELIFGFWSRFAVLINRAGRRADSFVGERVDDDHSAEQAR